jgi:hypothetical protein
MVTVTVRDVGRTSVVLAKVAYTLTGKYVRRVYWHKVWKDFTDDDDHNIKIEACKALLDKMKSVKEIL